MRDSPAIRLVERPVPLSSTSLVARFGTLIQSDLALRFARNFTVLGLPFPTFSDDEYEHYLVCEAMLERYRVEATEEKAEQDAFARARAENQEWLAARKAGAV